MRAVTPNSKHEAYLDALQISLAAHQHLSSIELLAITSQFVGILIAHQDQRKYSADQVMEIVGRNIEAGNQAVLEGLFDTRGRA